MDIDKYFTIPFYQKKEKRKILSSLEDINKYPQGYFKPKKCRFCETIFTPLTPSHHYCSEKCAIIARADVYYYRNYGISIEDYYQLYKKFDGKCYICKKEGFSLRNKGEGLVLDHNHLTNEVRGLLCPNCNRALGLFKDDIQLLDNAKEYLQQVYIPLHNHITKKIREIQRKSQKKIYSKEQIFKIYEMYYIQKLIPSKIASIIGITPEGVANIVKQKTRNKDFEEWKELRKCNDYPSGTAV